MDRRLSRESHARAHLDVPCRCLAHSTGALIAVGLAVQGRLSATGLITLGTALRLLAADGFAAAERAASSDPDAVVVPLGRQGFDASTRDPEMLAAVAADPTHHDVPGVPARFLHQVALVTAEVQTRLEAVDLPLLVLHGSDDVMADPAASVELFERARSTDRTLHLVGGGYHALLRDLGRETTLAIIVDWMTSGHPGVGRSAGNEEPRPTRPHGCPRIVELVHAEPDQGEANKRGWLGPGVAGIGGASFLADVGHEIPTSLLPSLLTTTLGAPASALGVIEGVSDALAGVARLGGGALADDPYRRRSVAVGGYATTAVLSAGLGAAVTPLQAGVLRAGAWTARGLRVPARNALLADLVPVDVYGKAYGFERAMDNLGAIAGPLLAIVLVGAVGTRGAIGLSVIPGLLAAVAIVYAIRHTQRPRAQRRPPIRLRVRPVLRGPLGRLMIGVTAFEIGNCAATLLILRSTELFQPGRTQDHATQLALVLYIGYNAAAALVSVPAGHHADRHGAIRLMVIGAATFAAAYLWFAVGPSGVVALAPAFVLAGIGIGCAETAEHAAVASLAPAGLRGSAFGLLAGIQAAGNLAASTIAGALWTAVSPTVAFVFLASAMVIAIPFVITSRNAAVA